MVTDNFQPDAFTIVHASAAGLDVHKMQITATMLTHAFSALPSGLCA